MHESLWEQATESDWPEEERRQWYRERPRDEEYYRIQRELLRDGLTRKAKLTQLPPHQEGEPTLWAIGFEGKSPLRLARGGGALPAAREPRTSTTSSPSSRSETWRRSGAWSGRKPCTSTSSPAAPPASSPSSGTPWPTRRACSGPAPPAPTATDRCTSASSKRWRNADAEASASSPALVRSSGTSRKASPSPWTCPSATPRSTLQVTGTSMITPTPRSPSARPRCPTPP